MTFALCPACRRAWTSAAPVPCCGVQPVAVNPFSGERKQWFIARISATRGRLDAITEAAHYRSTEEHRASLARGVAERGNTVQGWREA